MTPMPRLWQYLTQDWLTLEPDLVRSWCCGALAKRGDFREVGGQVWAVGRCERCYARDPACTDLDVRLAERVQPLRVDV